MSIHCLIITAETEDAASKAGYLRTVPQEDAPTVIEHMKNHKIVKPSEGYLLRDAFRRLWFELNKPDDKYKNMNHFSSAKDALQFLAKHDDITFDFLN